MHVYLLELPRTEGPSSFYIGQRKYSPEESTDYWGSGKFCQNYIKGKGKEWIRENVKKTVLLRDLPNQEALNYWETFAIADYRDRFGDRVVNQTKGGEGNSSPCTEEAKAKIAKASKEMWKSDEFRVRHKKAMKEVWESDEHRAKHKKASKERWKSDEFKARHKKVMKELWGSDEYRAKMNKVYKSREYITKMEKVAKKRWECPEYRAKMKAIWESPEYRAKQSEARKKLWECDERKARVSGENNPSYDTNSVLQVHKRGFESGDIKVSYSTFYRALNNPKHKKHSEYMELFNRYKVEDK